MSSAGATPRVERCVVIGDVHAQDGVLKVALAAAQRLHVDAMLFTGDVVDGPGSVSRCCQLLREHNVLCVRGNHDRWLFTGLLRDTKVSTQLHDITPEEQQFINGFPATREILIPGGRMLLCHGIGAHDLEKVTSFDTDYSLQTSRPLREVMDGNRYRLMVHGHTHERLVTRIGAFVIVNAGALHHPSDAGFVCLDFPRNTLTWHAISGAACEPGDEVEIFCERTASAARDAVRRRLIELDAGEAVATDGRSRSRPSGRVRH